MRGVLTPVVAGVAAALTGFCGSVAVLLTGLAAAGATAEQAASGLLILCVLQGVLSIGLSVALRIPAAYAWSTPGAALLVAAHRTGGSFASAVGAFLVAGLLIAVAGVVPALARLIERIPRALAGGLLAGVLLPFCLATATAAVAIPWAVVPLVVGWLVLQRFAPRLAGPLAIVAAVLVVVVSAGGAEAVPPVLRIVAPDFAPAALVGLGVPLAIVTMAGQNLPGLAVLRVNGYAPPTRVLVTAGGIGTMAGAAFGGVAVNLAAITGAITAGDDAGPDRSRRWIASTASGAAYLALVPVTGTAAAIVGTDPPLLIRAAAGLALLGALTGALGTALENPPHRLAGVVTFLVVASGIQVAGIGSAFWGVLAGLAALAVLRR